MSFNGALIFIKSIIFNIVLYLGLATSFVINQFFLGSDEKKARRFFTNVNKWINQWFCFCIGSKVKIYGKENLLSEPAIYAVRHESTWETITLMSIIPNSCFVLKAELASIPLFAGVIRKLKMIPIDRKLGFRAISHMTAQANDRLKDGVNVIIFPEGTRMPTGEFGELLPGVFALYKKTGAKVVPVALNSGRSWPRRKFSKVPKTVKVKFMPPINSGLEKEDFMNLLQNQIKSGVEFIESN